MSGVRRAGLVASWIVGLSLLVTAGCGGSEDDRVRKAFEAKLAEHDRQREEAQSKQADAKANVDLVLVPAGSFKMGDNSLGGLPERNETLDAFYIGRHEVSNGDYRDFVVATDAIPPFDWINGEPPAGRLEHPVRVPQIDAERYAKWIGCRLPTKEEWEKAARGEDGRKFPWGNNYDASLCHTEQGQDGDTCPVTRFPAGASPYGCLNMTGNVREWTSSTTSTDGGLRGILKGGGFADDNERKWLRCAMEYFARPTVEKNPMNGFRVARDA